MLADPEPRMAAGERGGEGRAQEAEELTSCAMPEAAGRAPCSAGRLSLGELQPDTGVLLLLGEESVPGREAGKMGTCTQRRTAQPQPRKARPPSNNSPLPSYSQNSWSPGGHR